MSKDITLGILYSGQLETQLIKSAKKNLVVHSFGLNIIRDPENS